MYTDFYKLFDDIKDNKINNIIIEYLRKSRADIAEEEISNTDVLKRHREMLDNATKINNDEITFVFEEVVSGETIKDRPQMQKVLKLLETGTVKKCYVIEIERLSRGDGEDQAKILKAFKYSNTLVVTPNKIYDLNDEFDENYFEFGSFMSHQEWKTIRKRLQRGRKKSAEEGKFIGSTPGFGYDKLKLKNQKGWILVKNKNAEVGTLIYNMFVNENLSLTDICRKLKFLNIKTTRGNDFTYFTLKTFLKNAANAGYIGFQKQPTYRYLENGIEQKKRKYKSDNLKLYKGLHEPLISLECWEMAQEKLAKNSTPPLKKNTELRNPFSGLVYCGKCKKAIVLTTPVKNKYSYMSCTTQDCFTYKTKFEIFENAVLDELRQKLKSYNYYISNYEKEYKKDLLNNEEQLNILNKHIIELDKQLINICELLEKNVYSIELFESRKNYIDEQKNSALLEKKKIEDTIKHGDIPIYKNIVPSIEKILNSYPSLAPKEKNKLLKVIIDKIYYYRDSSALKKSVLKNDFKIDIKLKIL